MTTRPIPDSTASIPAQPPAEASTSAVRPGAPDGRPAERRIVTVPPGRFPQADEPATPPPAPPRLPPADELPPETLSVLLWELVHWLADEHVFLELTDHLSDAELYEFLREEIADPDLFPSDGVTCASPLYGWSEEDCKVYVRYYADEDKRHDWADLFEGEEMPPREEPPYDRDRFLPVWRAEGFGPEP